MKDIGENFVIISNESKFPQNENESAFSMDLTPKTSATYDHAPARSDSFMKFRASLELFLEVDNTSQASNIVQLLTNCNTESLELFVLYYIDFIIDNRDEMLNIIEISDFFLFKRKNKKE